MRLQRLKLCDFQAHRELEIALAPTITTIVGPTDAGKSAVLRALRWICLNDLPGDAFIREGAKRAEVSLELDSGNTITRSKGAHGLNLYTLDDEEYQSFYTGVPSAIADLLRLDPLNFQAQHDSSYWFSETPGEVSRQLNAVVDLSIIDTTLSAVATEVRRASERKTIAAERLQTVQAEHDALQAQQERIDDFHQLETFYDRTQQVQQKHDKLYQILDAARRAYAVWKENEERSNDQDLVVTAGREAYRYAQRHAALAELIAEAETAEKTSTPPPSFELVESAYKALTTGAARGDRLRELVRRCVDTSQTLATQIAAQRTAEDNLHQQTKGKRCPLCQNPIR